MSYCLNCKVLEGKLQLLRNLIYLMTLKSLMTLKNLITVSRLFRLLLLSFIIICNFNPLIATDEFYNLKAEGWFWYKDDDFEKREEFKRVVPRASELSKYNEINLDKELEKKLKNLEHIERLPNGLLSSKDIKQLMPKALEMATDDPSIENLYKYFLLQKMAMEKSTTFATNSQYLKFMYPELSEQKLQFGYSKAKRIKYDLQREHENKIINSLAKDSMLVFYYKGSCKYCSLALSLLKPYINQGFKVIAISMDGVLFEDIGFYKHIDSKRYSMSLKHYPKSVPTIALLSPNVKKVKNHLRYLIVASELLDELEFKNRLIQIGQVILNININD